ncbi:unnamed protein product, partial [Iphiclides podalirius]
MCSIYLEYPVQQMYCLKYTSSYPYRKVVNACQRYRPRRLSLFGINQSSFRSRRRGNPGFEARAALHVTYLTRPLGGDAICHTYISERGAFALSSVRAPE